MSHQFSNFLLSSVRLEQGATTAFIPAGWSGKLNLQGELSVYGSTSSITTNIVPYAGPTTLTAEIHDAFSGQLLATTQTVVQLPQGNYDWPVTYGVATETIRVYGSVSALHPDTVTYSLGYSGDPQGMAQNLTGYTLGVATNTYTTNNVSDALIGTYTADFALRGVEVTSSGITLHDYSREAEMGAAGFVLALTIAFMTWTIRIVRGAGQLGGD